MEYIETMSPLMTMCWRLEQEEWLGLVRPCRLYGPLGPCGPLTIAGDNGMISSNYRQRCKSPYSELLVGREVEAYVQPADAKYAPSRQPKAIL